MADEAGVAPADRADGDAQKHTPDQPARVPAHDPTALAQALLVATRTGSDPAPLLQALAALTEDDLTAVREDRRTALAFWCNCYNAGTQLLLERRRDVYESRLRGLRFFRLPCLTVAGTPRSLDDIEQGILRASRSKYTLGYTPRLLVDSFEHRYALSRPDPRIHFALHCGAASCPAIRAYEPERVDEQLDLAAQTYLDATVERAAGVVRVPRLMLWYRGDFGGTSGILAFLRRYDVLDPDESPRIRYLGWDWSLARGTFVG